MKTRIALCLVTVVAFLSITALRGPARATGLADAKESRLVTLYAHDDLQSSFDFQSGRAGGVYFNGEVALLGGHVAFSAFEPDLFTYGFLRDEPTRILDLGEFYVPLVTRSRDAAPKLSASLFHSLFLDGGRFCYVDADGRVHNYKPANDIFAPLPTEGQYHLPPQVGHTYLVRTGERRGSGEIFAKFEVVDFHPGHSVTIRWARVPGA